MSKSGTPENLLDRSDPGDDTQRRFRYQATYAALKSLAMLEEESEVAYIFCEHWEDVLVKRTDERFIGIQIKTRAAGIAPFKTNDEEMINSLKRFVQLEQKFSEDFDRYVIAANCGFWRGNRNSSNLAYLIEIAQTSEPEEALSNKYLSQLLKKLAGASGDFFLVIKVLQKVILEDSPGLEDIGSRLFRALAHYPQVNHLTSQQILKIAEALIDVMSKAAALPKSDIREEYLVLLKNPQQEQTNLTIQNKKITVEQVLELMHSNFSVISDSKSTVLLKTHNQPSVSELQNGMRKMELKMIAGDVSVANVELAKSHKFSAEYLLNQWLFKHGLEKADSQYQHLCTIIWTECREAHDHVYTEDSPFGSDMLKVLRGRLRDRYNQDRQHFFECTYEHLCGIAGILTEECLVWWSPEFEIPAKETK